ncbi:MAG: DUF2236 domain-containing protein [Myxococcales bacterium]|nr:DUF2236 domain-containing protein [Myxococcales bacterium]
MKNIEMPDRVVRRDEARTRFGTLIDRVAPSLLRQDPLADAAIAALSHSPTHPGGLDQTIEEAFNANANIAGPVIELIQAAEDLPAWVDFERVEKAGQLLFRSGLVGGLVLGARSLMAGYASPAGNKPLVLSGHFRSKVRHRLAETAKFVSAVASPGGMLPGADGFRITLKVRLIHAQVRALIKQHYPWPTQRWGAPINQHDMMATVLLFAHAWLDGVEALGIHISSEEAENYVHLWRYVGHVLGVEHDLLPATRSEGDRLLQLIMITEGDPDNDARSLVRAFLEHPLALAQSNAEHRMITLRMQAYKGIVRGLLGEKLADQLGIPNDMWKYSFHTVRKITRNTERLRRHLPGGERLAVQAGQQHWQHIVEFGLNGLPADFALPKVLTGLANRSASQGIYPTFG